MRFLIEHIAQFQIDQGHGQVKHPPRRLQQVRQQELARMKVKPAQRAAHHSVVIQAHRGAVRSFKRGSAPAKICAFVQAGAEPIAGVFNSGEIV
jgi:hypothetical protein